MRKLVSALAVGVVALACPLAAHAQWSSDSSVNLAIAAKPDAQVRPEVRVLPDGSCYVSWLDDDPTGSPPFGFDVFLQYLDATGTARWDAGGVRIADRGFASPDAYGLDVDVAGNALLAFRDDRMGPERITAAKVSPSGVPLWGATGIQLSSGTDATSSPGIVGTTDGNAVVAWSGSGRNGDGSAVRVVKLDGSGGVIWSASSVARRGDTYTFSDITASVDGSVIVSWVSTDAAGERHLVAQKYVKRGHPEWKKGVVIFDGGSLPPGELPKHVADGAGGAAFAWSLENPREVYAQHLSSDGTEAFPHDGLAPATNGNERIEPSIAYDAIARHTVLLYHEITPRGDGVYGQRFAAWGIREWGGDGAVFAALTPAGLTFPTGVVTGSGRTLGAWVEQTSPGQQRIFSIVLGVTGQYLCPYFGVSTLSVDKSGLDADVSPTGDTILVWEDGRTDASDIYGQRIAGGCGLGAPGGTTPKIE